MKKLLWSLLASLTLATPGYAVSPEQVSEDKFEFVCKYTYVFYGASCEGIERPWVVVSKIVSPSYLGVRYLDENIVFIRPELDPALHDEVVVHEVTHYVVDFGGAELDRCQSEEAARRGGALWSGRSYSEAWRAQYRC